MVDYTAHVELRHGGSVDYAHLHHDLNRAVGAVRTIRSDAGAFHTLPTGTYIIDGWTSDGRALLDTIVRIADAIEPGCGVILTGDPAVRFFRLRPLSGFANRGQRAIRAKARPAGSERLQGCT
jgi:hypothetical protein